MTPHVPEPAGLVAPEPRQMRSLAFQEILAYYRGELSDPRACAAVEDQLRHDRRWQAHWESIRYLDLDRAAAVQDGSDLAQFTEAQATPFCRAVAESCGRVFDALSHGATNVAGSQRREWTQHADGCVYCRRMQRLAHARTQHREAGLPANEPLLRDWLLEPCYLESLREATRRLGFEWRPDVPESGDTIINLDTVVQNPPSESRPQT